MQSKTQALRAAFPHTLPVLTGFLFLGSAYGILMSGYGFSPVWAILSSIFIFAGSMQFVSIGLLQAPFDPLGALLMTLTVNARHMFYGLSMLEEYRGQGAKKPYLVFGLIDETFSILCATRPPDGVDKGWFYFFTTLLNHLYWLCGTAVGLIVGSALALNTDGIGFVMTALFVVAFINQWRANKRHLPALVGIAATVLCLLLFDAGSFLIPAMVLITTALTLLRGYISTGEEG